MHNKQLTFNKPAKVFAITGGKGGVGKTSISINLAMILADFGLQVMLLDADIGLANIDVMLGLRANKNLQDVMLGKCNIADIILNGPKNIKIIPACSGSHQLAASNYQQISGLITALATITQPADYLLIDTAAGISEAVLGFVAAANEVVLVVCNEPTSIADAYALMKILNKQFNIHKFRVITNKIRDFGESNEVFAKLTKVADKFLNVSITLIGSIPDDKFMCKAIRKNKAVVMAYPNAISVQALRDIARNIVRLPTTTTSTGNLQFYQQQVILS